LGKRTLPASSGVSGEMGAKPWSIPSTSLTPWSFDADDGISSNSSATLTGYSNIDDVQFQLTSGTHHLSVDPSTQPFSLNDTLTLDGLFAFEDYTSGQVLSLPDVSMSLYGKVDQQLGWCSWTRGDVSLSVVTESPAVGLDSNRLAILQRERPYAQHNANIVIRSLRSFPTMMLRRETFPWFIHPHSQVFPKPARATLPEALSTCMSIAQMFASRTPETKGILWRTIRVEFRRFVREVRNIPILCPSHSNLLKMIHMSMFELLASVQACMVYLIMCIIDQSPESEECSLELVMALKDLYIYFKDTSDGPVGQSELSNPSSTWEDWIFAESQRRYTFYFISVRLSGSC
jgi:hypothetical protein